MLLDDLHACLFVGCLVFLSSREALKYELVMKWGEGYIYIIIYAYIYDCYICMTGIYSMSTQWMAPGHIKLQS